MLMKADARLQTFLMFIAVMTIYAIAVLAFIQVTNSLFLGFYYNDRRRKRYLKTLFWVQGVGTLLAIIFAALEIGFLTWFSTFFVYTAWLIFPFFMAFWSVSNSWKAVKEAKLEIAKKATF